MLDEAVGQQSPEPVDISSVQQVVEPPLRG